MKLSASLFTILATIGAANAASEHDKRSPLQVHPMPPVPKPYQVEYDDGTKSPMMRLKIRGDEEDHHLIYEETLDGYTVMPSAKLGGKYTYRDVDMHTGELIDTGLVFGQDNPNSKNVHKGAATKSDALKMGIAHPDARGLRGGPSELLEKEGHDNNRRTAITSGLLKNLVVPMRFSDHTTRTLPSRADLNVMMNNQGPATQCPTGSVRDVFTESSFGQLDIQSTVVDWVTLDFTESYCANGNSGLSSRIHECLTNALDKVAASGVDFRDYDLDGNGRIDGITFFHSGYAAEWGGTDGSGTFYTNRIWSHKWAIWSTNWSNNGVRVYEYHINPSLWARSGSNIGRIGVVAHETGHFLGLPDLYDYGDATFGDGEGIGSWGLMANSWGFDGSQLYPPIMSAWSKYVLGWTNPTEVSTSGTYSLGQACDNNEMIIIRDGYPSGEYLLIENRQPCGFESRMPQGGLAIFHIDDNANNIRGYPGQTGWPGNGNHYEVALLQADATYGLERGFNRGDSGDMFHAGGVNSIGPDGTSTGATYPNTKAYQGGSIVDTEVTISNIGAAGARMTFDITIGSDAVTPTASPNAPFSASPSASSTNSPTKTPTSSTKSPTKAPTRSTKSPTKAPTRSPTQSPTRSPTQSPTRSPTQSPTQSPTSSPTTSPSRAPVDTPSNGSCQDFPNPFKVQLSNGKFRFRTCDWVGTNTSAHCELNGVKATCPSTCGTCSTCEDSPLKLRVYINTRRRHKFCAWVAKKSRVRCELAPAIKIGCKETCGQC